MGGRSSKKKAEEAERLRLENEKKAATSNGAGKDRITANDKAIIDIKARMRKLRNYEEKLSTQDKEATDKIKELIKAG